MKIKDLRPSFTAYLVGFEQKRTAALAAAMSQAGYSCLQFLSMTDAFSEFPSNPPHMLIIDVKGVGPDLEGLFQQVKSQLPESHLFALIDDDDRRALTRLYQLGLYDFLSTSPSSANEWIRALDRAAERDYFMYLNEQLSQSAGVSSDGNSFVDFLRRMDGKKTLDECVRELMHAGSDRLGKTGAVFLRYLASRKVLTAAVAVDLPNVQWQGAGIDFHDDPGFKLMHLREPRSLPHLRDFVKEIFGQDEFQALSFEINNEFSGIVLFFGKNLDHQTLEYLHFCRDLAQQTAAVVELNKRLHALSLMDETTSLLNRHHFMSRVAEEVARARRTEMAVCLLIMSLDQYGSMVTEFGADEGQTVLKAFAQVLQKHSRVNDIIGRVGSDEFGMILPHTTKEGAAIKAERLRRMIESADFTKVIKSFPHLTISIGVSEYPSVCRDADELFQTADEALFQVRERQNKVCLAQAPEAFEPDFLVKEKSI